MISPSRQAKIHESFMDDSKAKVALITGITGQDGSYLTEFLLDKGYIVHGIIRRSSSFNTGRIEHLFTGRDQKSKIRNTFGQRLFLHHGDMTDSSNLTSIIGVTKPDEIYNLAAQSHVKVSFSLSEYTAQVDATGFLRILNAVIACDLTEKTKIYQASTSELYGKVQEVPQTEKTPFYPRSPYAVAKQYAFWIGVNYREAYNMHITNGILFNHESPRRGQTFVTRKITMAVAKIHKKKQDILLLGNLSAKRDWGHARDYVEAMWMMLQQNEPDDYVLATGETHEVREFVYLAFQCVGVEIEWKGEGVEEVGVEKGTDKILVKVDPQYFRPTEVDLLIGDPAKAKKKLGWEPTCGFKELVQEMVKADLELVED
eukprot:maker-scaffold_9-snap-gene-6.49-mRNA-1 protein AED:0.03 eAED:0.03 QI:139/1/1/1/1/1/4/234/371